MRKRLIIGLAIVNGLFALALFAVPAHTQFFRSEVFDCCKQGTDGPFCCNDCCWFISDCVEHEDCEIG